MTKKYNIWWDEMPPGLPEKLLKPPDDTQDTSNDWFYPWDDGGTNGHAFAVGEDLLAGALWLMLKRGRSI